MVQPAESWHRYNLSTYTGLLLPFTSGRSTLRQRKMRSIFVVVTDVLFHQPFHMALIENDHVVEQISSTAANPTHRDTVLPRTLKGSSFELDAQCFDGTYDLLIEVRGSIEDQVFRSGIVRECFA